MKERDGCSAVRFPVGWLLLCWRDCTLVGAEWRWEAPPLGEMQGQPCAEQATAEIAAYLVDPLHAPAIPWTFDRGTPFQQKVWQALADIPAGSVCSYGALAARLGSAPRAIGQACGRNPLALVLPCHRVVAATGIGGYSAGPGPGVPIKRWLLNHERVVPIPG